MFNKNWFEKHQGILVWFANTSMGRKFFEINGLYDIGKKKIVRMTPNSISWRKGSAGYTFINKKKIYRSYYIQQFRTFDIFSVKLLQFFLPFLWIPHLWDTLFANKFFPALNLGFDTFTASGSGEGKIQAHNATYLTARNASTGAVSIENSRPVNMVIAGPDYYVGHGYCPFDTSGLPDGITIIEGSNTFLRFVSDGSGSDADSDSITAVASTQASPTALASSDFPNVGTTQFATPKTITSTISAGNIDFQLNSSGIANINLTGYSQFAWRTTKDLSATAPSGYTWGGMVDATNLLSAYYIASNIKVLSAVPYASIKKIIGIAILSAKKIGGVA